MLRQGNLFASGYRRLGDYRRTHSVLLRRIDIADDAALEAAGLERAMLSAPLAPGACAGAVGTSGARTLGLRAGIPFAVGSLDHHCAALGAGLGTLAPMSESTGTVLAALRATDDYRPDAAYCVGPGVGGRGYYQLAFRPNGAGAFDWYQRTHAPHATLEDLSQLAADVPPGAEGLVARPQPDSYPELEGFLDVRADHTPGHYARAIFESVAASLVDLVENLSPAAPPERLVATGGGARSDAWLQVKANLLGLPVIRPACAEPACLGAALFAAVARGWFPAVEAAAAAMVRPERPFETQPAAAEAYREWLPAYRARVEAAS